MDALQSEYERLKAALQNRFNGSAPQRTVWRKRIASLKTLIQQRKEADKLNPQLNLKLK